MAYEMMPFGPLSVEDVIQPVTRAAQAAAKERCGGISKGSSKQPKQRCGGGGGDGTFRRGAREPAPRGANRVIRPSSNQDTVV